MPIILFLNLTDIYSTSLLFVTHDNFINPTRTSLADTIENQLLGKEPVICKE